MQGEIMSLCTSNDVRSSGFDMIVVGLMNCAEQRITNDQLRVTMTITADETVADSLSCGITTRHGLRYIAIARPTYVSLSVKTN